MKPSWLKGKTLAIISSSLHLDFTLLDIVSMFALMVDRFLALYLDLKYLTWKTTKRAYFAVLLIWLGCTMVVATVAIPLFDMDFDNQTLKESRLIIFNQRKSFVASIMATFVTAATVLGFSTSYIIYQKKNQVREVHIQFYFFDT